jgi:quercetin dioxygenase-like cupin family protein
MVLLENSKVRVFRVKLQPDEATLPHRHTNFYAYLSLQPVTLANEVRGRPPVMVSLEASDVHTSKGGFAVAERNKSSQPAELIVIEEREPAGAGFDTPMGGFRFHDAAFGDLFQASVMRAYTMTIAAGGRTEKHEEHCDRLVLAVTDLKLREDVAGQPPSELHMKAGEVQWFSKGTIHATTNVDTAPATFITFELE